MKRDQTSPMKEQEYFSQNIHFYIDIIVDKYGNDYNSDKLRKFGQFYLNLCIKNNLSKRELIWAIKEDFIKD